MHDAWTDRMFHTRSTMFQLDFMWRMRFSWTAVVQIHFITAHGSVLHDPVAKNAQGHDQTTGKGVRE